MKHWGLVLSIVLVASLLAGCGATPEPQVVEVEKVVTEIVMETVKETVKETVIVEGTPEVVEKEVTKVVEKVVEVEKVVTPTPEPEPEKEAGEIVVVAPVTNEAKTLSPDFQADTGAYYPSGNIYSSLVTMDWGVVTGTGAYGDLADSWDIEEDGRIYTFHLAENAVWHDGEPVTSADVKYTFDTMIEKKYPYSNFLADVKEIRTPDDHTVVIELNLPDIAFVPMMAQAANWYGKIMPKHIMEGTEWDSGPQLENPIGSGPFKFVEWVKGSHMVLEANDDYFRGRTAVDKLIVRVIPDKNVAQAEFFAGNLIQLPYDYAPPPGEVKILMESEDINAISTPSHYSRDLYINTTVEPLSNPLVRQALAHAVNREEINETGFAGLWIPSRYAGVPRMETFLNKDAMFPDYDPEKAEALLDEAGYPRGDDGMRFDLSVTNPVYTDSKIIAEITVEQFKAVGINASWDEFDQATWWQKMNEGDFEVSVYFTRYGPDPDAYREHFSTGGARNFHGYSNPELDEIVDAARRTSDIEERKELYGQVQEMIVRDIPYINMFSEVKFSLQKPGWEGFPVQESGYDKSMGWFSVYAVTPPE
jgi:peptide/nickel transport system substrate-binding protein